MAAWSRIILSGSTSGQPISVVQTSTATTVATLHTAATATAITDHVYLWAANTATVARVLSLHWGATTGNGQVDVTVPPEDGAYKIADGWPIKDGLIISAYGTATAIASWIFGYVNRAT